MLQCCAPCLLNVKSSTCSSRVYQLRKCHIPAIELPPIFHNWPINPCPAGRYFGQFVLVVLTDSSQRRRRDHTRYSDPCVIAKTRKQQLVVEVVNPMKTFCDFHADLRQSVGFENEVTGESDQLSLASSISGRIHQWTKVKGLGT